MPIMESFGKQNRGFVQSVQDIIGNSHASQLALGAGAYLATLFTQTVAQSFLKQMGHVPLNMREKWVLNGNNLGFFSKNSLSHNVNVTLAPIGKQFFFNEFIQDYLLGDTLRHVLSKVAPSYTYSPHSDAGRFLRIFATSVLYSAFCHAMDKNLPLNATARFANDFVLAFFAGYLKDQTRSNLPGLGLYLADAHLNA